MILEQPLKGDAVKIVVPLTSRRYKPMLCLLDAQGEKHFISWENLMKILNSVDYDIDKKRIRKHLIPLIKDKE